PHRRYRPLRLRQIFPCLRHHLRRRSAPLCRNLIGVRAPILRSDGAARRRFHRRPLPRHLDRAEDHLSLPPLDRRHHHRDLRLPPPPLRLRWAAALPQLPPPHLPPVRRPD